jgi:hypothetical protein
MYSRYAGKKANYYYFLSFKNLSLNKRKKKGYGGCPG